MVKLYLSTPCYGGVCLEEYASSILKLQMHLAQNKIELMYDSIENESLVHRARNVAVGRFMQKSDADFFMFIDADIHFEPDAVTRLIKADKEIAVAIYPKKCVMWDQVKHTHDNGGTADELLLKSSSMVVNVGAKSKEITNGMMSVLDGPTGFMLIKRQVFKKMEERFEDLKCVNDHQNRDIDHYYALFDCMIDPESKRYLSEDYAFCRRWQQMGGEIYTDIGTTLGHVGNLPFEGSLYNRLKASAPTINK